MIAWWKGFCNTTPSAIEGLVCSAVVAAAMLWVNLELFAQVTALFHHDPQDGWVMCSRTWAVVGTFPFSDFHETTEQTKMASLIQHYDGRWLRQNDLESHLVSRKKWLTPGWDSFLLHLLCVWVCVREKKRSTQKLNFQILHIQWLNYCWLCITEHLKTDIQRWCEFTVWIKTN